MSNLLREIFFGLFIVLIVGGLWTVAWSQKMDSRAYYVPADADAAVRLAAMGGGEIDPDEDLDE